MCILESELLQAYSVIESAHLIFMKQIFLFTTDESMKTAPHSPVSLSLYPHTKRKGKWKEQHNIKTKKYV